MLNTAPAFHRPDPAIGAHLTEQLLTAQSVRELNDTFPADDRFQKVVVATEVKRFQLGSLWLHRDGAHLPALKELDPAWTRLLDQLAGPAFLARLSTEVDMDLAALPRDIGLFTHAEGEFISPHHDEPEKALTVVLYFNEDWPADGGGHFEVRASHHGGRPPVRSLPPTAGSLIAFDSSVWHATSTVTAPRTLRAAVLEFWRVRPRRAE
ncbi:2OG-Fe(II) oxygenase [Streptomyces sp. CBMA123]|uniref:2OG-Fe(II) oxygenase n=1 Tax=Streptomyces sp. CBMA123 TaxID=1896313 RepID=UPI001661E7B6|nr:2OG-Fe(II) oxygenase [Streptomyces sp. CBMA123]MBD0694682.1 hypothetical protein [Streptomyces sp. CBMA123]